jgi:hypothetical protein
MKRYFSFFLLTFISVFATCSYSQKLEWKTGVNYFFDNTEFARSTITKDQTMTGTHIAPELGVSWDSTHFVYGGLDMLKLSGSRNVIDSIHPIAYYQYKSKSMTFYAGAFPRGKLLSNYSSLFFQDSIYNFRPNLTGVFWKVGEAKSFFTFWMDWSGHQTYTDHETFFVGGSGHHKLGHFFMDFQSYMFHYASTMAVKFHVTDNILGHLSFGADYSDNTGLDTLMLAVGVLGGVERDRTIDRPDAKPVGAVVRFNVEYKGIGTDNILYVGDPRDVYYDKYNTHMYWNNPFLRANYYLQNQVYINLLKRQDVRVRFVSRQHFSEGKLMFEQYFTALVNLDSSEKNTDKSLPFLKRLLQK